MNPKYKNLFLFVFLFSFSQLYAATPKPSFKGVEFKPSTNVLCSTGQFVTYKNETDEKILDGEFKLSYAWTFEGGVPNTYLGETPPAIKYNIIGVFKTTLIGKALNSKGEVLGMREYSDLIIVENPKINLGMDKSICANSAIMLDAGLGFEKYKWSPENNNGKLGDEQKLEVNKSGVYKVTASTKNGCETSDIIKISAELCTGIISNERNNNLKTYPNPAKDVVNIEATFSTASDLRIVFTNSTGQEKTTLNYINTTNIIDRMDISAMIPGIYRANYYVNGVLAKSINLIIQ